MTQQELEHLARMIQIGVEATLKQVLGLENKTLEDVVRDIVVSLPPVVPPSPADLAIPFLLNERELKQYEQFIAEEDRPVLRHRVYAARAVKAGNHATAAKMRKKADRLEMQLEASRKVAA